MLSSIPGSTRFMLVAPPHTPIVLVSQDIATCPLGPKSPGEDHCSRPLLVKGSLPPFVSGFLCCLLSNLHQHLHLPENSSDLPRLRWGWLLKTCHVPAQSTTPVTLHSTDLFACCPYSVRWAAQNPHLGTRKHNGAPGQNNRS